MADQNDGKQKQTLNHANQEDPGTAGGANIGGNIGGNPGSQHNDWGHSPVPTEDSQSGNRQSSDAAGQPRQGVMPGEEMGHLQRGKDDGAQKR